MKKYMTITGMVCNQIYVGENIQNNFKETDIEIEQQVSKNNDSVKENKIRQKNNIATRKNRILNKNIRDIPKKYFIILLILIILIILICRYYNFLKNKENFDYSTLGDELPCVEDGTEFEIMDLEVETGSFFKEYQKTFVEEFEKTKDKKFFLCYVPAPGTGPLQFSLFSEKNNNGQKTYEKHEGKNILLHSFFFDSIIIDFVLKNFFQNNPKIINVQGKELLPIDYKDIIDIFKKHYCFFSESVSFFIGNGFEQIYSYNFHKKKNIYKEIKGLTASEKEFDGLIEFFSGEIKKKLKQIDGIDDFTKMIKEIVSVLPQKKELQFLKIKYIFCYYNDQSPGLQPVFCYKNIKETEKIEDPHIGIRKSNLGCFINTFYKVVKKLHINIQIINQNQKAIKVNEKTLFEIPSETILFLQKELKDLILFEDKMCCNVFDSKNITYLIKSTELETKEKKFLQEQEKKIREYFKKKPIRGPIKINELPKIMKKCLLRIDILKD